MSTLKVDAIRHNSATSDAITTAADGTCTAKITSVGGGQLSHRNLLINGAMIVSQRGTSSTSAGYQTVDRFQSYFANTGVTVTQSQQSLSSSDTPYTSGFRYFYRTALSGGGTANANAEVGIFYRSEAQDIANSGWNYISSSSYITLQFWFRCSTNQTFYCYLESQDGTGQSYPISFTATGNNTWTKITKTFPGNSNLQFDNNNAYGLQLAIIPFYGTDLTNNKTLNQWSAWTSANRTPDMASTWLTAGASTFDVTGVQLEVGDTATSFEHRSVGDELARCKRYYEQFDSNGLSEAPFGVGYFEANNQLRAVVPLHEKRADVSFSSTAASTFASMNTLNMPAGSSIALYKTGKKAAIIVLTLSGDVTSGDGRAGILCAQSSTEATLKFSAEL